MADEIENRSICTLAFPSQTALSIQELFQTENFNDSA